MDQFCRSAIAWMGAAGLFLLSASPAVTAEAEPDTQTQLRQLQRQNEVLQQQMRKQQSLIEDLNRKVSDLQATDSKRKGEGLMEDAKANPDSASQSPVGFSMGKLHLSGEGAVGFFHSQSQGQFPNSEFRVDEAKLFLEAPIWKDVYFFSEIDFFTREESSVRLRAGELYLDVENVSQLWHQDRQLNLRVGRFDIPFGEEYLSRDAIDNPLISHSLMDLWGIDEGLELHGSFNQFQYVLAVQNGGHDGGRDFNRDKAVVARVGFDPAHCLHLSVSAMRTGRLDVNQDETSELWLGPSLVYSLGSPNTTVFEANLLQGDVHLKLPRTVLKASGGVLQYKDDDPTANNRREVYYYTVEGVQSLHKGFYAAARWSQVFARKGFPIAGIGDANTYAFGTALTEDLWLLSLGLGYRLNHHLVLKSEYSFQRGRTIQGETRDREDLFALTAVYGF